uniref:Variant surface glycoprotein n=2 Tax=Trypanosoma brucei TaxID=5691 RepID=B3GVH9_TRYBB|nr:Chain A, Variant surface glycoprotein MITat 1.21 [Trypanosoma brucei brucei]8Q0P_B Chain B, Variant surface glycoprotein MITat 1.21 [Trypanosoma brucei brucei]8Q0P_C Chain C, Variant surface glycoprotein MITat 1.21 [Trypanosoma brucei brucei]8Q0P_D Chain D, Variant surface glycoprotein MITat 1.21 [Trypanosoma brucei brucei]8Q0P_E Chain E, Variant surface glycoprotein MITat 1.21 [Trypanosoma brucei brucei]8Q0P_F Chain F, Variant surface glycoprotein MITat 1.21 [Trypanosoma brucei brucei]AAX
MNYWIAATGALALAVAVTAQGTTLLHNAKAQVTTPCGASHYMRHITRQAESALQAGLKTAQSALETSNKLRVVASSKTGGAATAASILAANLASEAAKAIETIKTETKNFLAGFAAAAELAGQQTIVSEIKSAQVQDVNTLTAAQAVTTPGIIQVKPKLTIASTAACFNDDGSPVSDDEAAQPNQGEPTLKFFVVSANTPGTTHNELLTICGHGSTGTAPSTGCQNDATSIGIKGGDFLKTAAVTTTRLASSAGKTYPAITSTTTIPNDKTLNKAVTAIRELETAVAALDAISDVSSPEDIAARPELTEAIAKALDGDKAKVDSFAAETFGKESAIVKSTIVKDLKDLKPPKSAVGGSGEKKLETINDPKELADAQIYYTVKKFVDEQEQKKKNQASPSCPTNTDKTTEPAKSADECKKHTTSDDCKDEKGCEFDEKKDPKCFPKVDTEKKDDKSFSSNVRVSVPQVFAALVLAAF